MKRHKSLFDTSVDFKILSLFFDRPTTRFYVKQLARQLGISPSSASTGLKRLYEQGFLSRTREGKECYYALVREKPLNKHFSLAYFLFKLEKAGLVRKLLDTDSQLCSIALYGSIATGCYDEASDLDLLILAKIKKDEFYPLMSEIGKDLKREVIPTVMPFTEWLKLARKKDAFYTEVVKNHVLLYGSRLVV